MKFRDYETFKKEICDIEEKYGCKILTLGLDAFDGSFINRAFKDFEIVTFRQKQFSQLRGEK